MNSFNKSRATVAEFKQKGLPILSIDSKKKEFIGQFYRPRQILLPGKKSSL